jgi:hypothetical protein
VACGFEIVACEGYTDGPAAAEERGGVEGGDAGWDGVDEAGVPDCAGGEGALVEVCLTVLFWCFGADGYVARTACWTFAAGAVDLFCLIVNFWAFRAMCRRTENLPGPKQLYLWTNFFHNSCSFMTHSDASMVVAVRLISTQFSDISR